MKRAQRPAVTRATVAAVWDDVAAMPSYTADARTRLTREQHEQLTALAERKGMPLAVYMRTVLIEHLEQERERREAPSPP